MKRAIAAFALLLAAACDPPAPELDGAPPSSASPAPASSLPPDPLLPPGEQAGGAGAASTAALGIVAPMGVEVIQGCEAIIAADYTSPPKMDCLLLQTADHEPGKIDAGVFVAISEAGWNLIRSQGTEHYLERPVAGTDCAEIAVVSMLTDRLKALVDHAGAGKPAGAAIWQAYSIPASTHQACGADRMKP